MQRVFIVSVTSDVEYMSTFELCWIYNIGIGLFSQLCYIKVDRIQGYVSDIEENTKEVVVRFYLEIPCLVLLLSNLFLANLDMAFIHRV